MFKIDCLVRVLRVHRVSIKTERTVGGKEKGKQGEAKKNICDGKKVKTAFEVK